jgi:antitoxin MazE
MFEAVLDIKAWGNSLGVRLPAAVARAAGLRLDQRVRVSAEAGRVTIEPVADAPLTLAQRLALFDPELHGGEAMAGGPVGRERL